MTFVLAVVGTGGCHAPARTTPLDSRAVPQTELQIMAQVAKDFWLAAARGDSVQMARLSAGNGAIAWAHRQRQAYPTFFDATNGRVVLRWGYFLRTAMDTAIVEIEVPWQTCPPPVHEGKADRYFLKLVPLDRAWRVTDIWIDPC